MAHHTIAATFKVKTFVITPTAGPNGTITPGTPQTVNCGGSAIFTIAPNTGYVILDVKVDGVSQGAITTYAFTNVTANHTIAANSRHSRSSSRRRGRERHDHTRHPPDGRLWQQRHLHDYTGRLL